MGWLLGDGFNEHFDERKLKGVNSKDPAANF
jgi:hypothetical protein